MSDNIVNATYVTSWDGYKKTIEAECKIDIDTGLIFDIGSTPASETKDLQVMDEEYVSYGPYDLSVKNDGLRAMLAEYSLQAVRDSLQPAEKKRQLKM